jgi:glycosyltransferase involved in cell wall biosynthesis
MAQPAPDSREEKSDSAPPPRLRPAVGGVVSLKIGILGTRGVPPRYGGFETFAAELGTRLVARGHQVSVYCRASHEKTWNGIERIVLPAIRHKYFETVSHALLSALDAMRRDFDVVLVCNAANAFVLPLLRAARIPVAINVDGIERRRRKWNLFGRMVYAAGESLSVIFADRIVADADVIADYYRQTYSVEPVVIPYGSDFPDDRDTDVLTRFGLVARNYILYVSRFEPENNPLEVVQAYEQLKDAPPIVMVGEGLYAEELVRELHRHAAERILFPGAVYGADYRTLQRNALVYIQATEVGGTHPAMIEAMASGGAVLAHDTPENREVGGDAVRYFQLRPVESLSGMLRECLGRTADLDGLRRMGRERARSRYRWDEVTNSYERLFTGLSR